MSFYDKVYGIVLQIPRGKVATYGQIAALCGSPRASRAVGYALHQNPAFGVIPCHRVVNREGRVAPGFAFGGPGIQRQMLEEEGVRFADEEHVALGEHLWDGRPREMQAGKEEKETGDLTKKL